MKKICATGMVILVAMSNMAFAAGAASPFPPGYDRAYAAYIAALPVDARKLAWLTKLNGVSAPARPLKLGAKTVSYLFGCKEHACDTDQANIFLAPDKISVMAVIKINGVQKLIGGAGPKEVACVKKLDASGGSAPTC